MRLSKHLLALGLIGVLLVSASIATAQNLGIGNYTLSNTQRVSRTEYNYTYTAEITNTGPEVLNVTATVTSNSPHTIVIDGSLSFGDLVAGGNVASIDTFTIRQDRLYPLNWSDLFWNITFERPLVSVPNVVGMAQAVAESTIAMAQLTVGTITIEYSDIVPAGVIISQTPPAGTSIAPGSAVHLVVSLGPTGTEGEPPVISNLNAPATVPISTTATVTFDYADPDGDITAVEVSQTNVFGNESATLPASLFNITGVSGQGSFPVKASELSFGDTTITLQLKDSGDRLSNLVTFMLTVTGDTPGGTVPTIENFTVLTTPWNRPVGAIDRLKPLFSFAYHDPEGDIVLVRKRIVNPTGEAIISEDSASSQDIEGLDGVVEKSLLTFRATDPLGTYTIELTAIDQQGNFSNTATASVELVETGGAVPLFISGFSPQQGVAGTEVTLTGGGFDTTTPENNQVELYEMPAEITNVTASSLTLIIPAGASSSPFVVRNQQGAAASDATFVVPTAVILTPDAPEVVVSGTLQFETMVLSSAAQDVLWNVNGMVGGNPAVGTITAEGLYNAPADIPSGGSVTVAAALASDPTVVGTSQVTILPPPLTPGKALILASVGGKIYSEDYLAAIDIPAGALPMNTEIALSVLRGDASPTPEASRQVLGAVKLEPSGLTFNSPVTLTLPLSHYHVPGTTLPLSFVAPDGSFVRDENIIATVLENGEQAAAQILHFSTAVVDREAIVITDQPPTITEITPSSGLEGMDVPVLIKGTNLGADLTIEVDGWGGMGDIIPGALYVNGETNELGVLLKIQTIEDFPKNSWRAYTIRLERKASNGEVLFTERHFNVQGLDELDVDPGEWVLNPPSGRYSQIHVDGTLKILSDETNLEATNSVVVRGIIDASGDTGDTEVDAYGQTCGGLPIGEYIDRCGRAGTNDGRGGLGRDNGDDPEKKHFGANAERFSDSSWTAPRGAGGPPGENVELNFDLDSGLEAVAKCAGFLTKLYGGSDGISSCINVARNIADYAPEVMDLLESSTGRRGFGAFPESDGGGGGGGGRLRSPELAEVTIPFTKFKGSLSFALTGGGGGAGGKPGHTLSILSPDPIHLATMGKITAKGGQGGRGSSTGRIQVIPHVSFLFWGKDIDLSTNLEIDDLVPITGGGGGGGAGGKLLLTSGKQLTFSNTISPGTLSSQVNAQGGRGGFGGKTLVEQHSGKTITLVENDAASLGWSGDCTLSDPYWEKTSITETIFASETIDTMVTDRTLLANVLINAAGDYYDRNTGISGYYPVKISVVYQDTGEVANTIIERTTSFATGNILLRPGFNTVTAHWCAGDCASSTPSPMHELLQKRILVMAVDSDGDGLGDKDEADLGTDPFKRDTDDDGLTDAQEAIGVTDPLDSDSDDDGLNDGDEINTYQTNPLNPDTDGDGMQDSTEIFLGSDPKSATSTPSKIPAGSVFAVSGDAAGTGYLTLIDLTTGKYGFLGQPAGGADFGITSDYGWNFYLAKGTMLARHSPMSNITVDIAAFHDSSGTPVHITQIAYNPVDNGLYGIENGAAPDFLKTGQLVAIDRETALVTRIGAAGSAPLQALAFASNGILFAVQDQGTGSDWLVQIDPASGTVTRRIGAIGFAEATALTFDQSGALLAANCVSETESQLLNINLAIGQGVELTTVHRAISALTVFTPPVYAITPIGNPSNLISSVSGVNDAGQVVGNFLLYNDWRAPYHAFFWDPNTRIITDIGTFGGSNSAATAINNAGQVVGWANPPNNNYQGVFLWDPLTRRLSPINGLGGQRAGAASINAAGLVVGSSETTDGKTHAFLWNPATPTVTTDLDTLGNTNSNAFKINTAGQVFGTFWNINVFGNHLFVWDPIARAMTDLGVVECTVSEGWCNMKTAMNAHGQTIGNYSYEDDEIEESYDFLWDPFTHTIIKLNTLKAYHLNDVGQVVGYISPSGSGWRAALWTDGAGLYDLHDLLDPNDPLFDQVTMQYATAISNTGKIAVNGLLTAAGESQAFLLTPVRPAAPVYPADLGTLGGTESYAYAVNDQGQVVGESLLVGDTDYHAFRWDSPDSPMTDLQTLGGTYSAAYGINNAGQIVGESSLSDEAASHAFLWDPNTQTMTDLGTLGGVFSWANAINSSGQVVGSSSLTSGNASHAFLWDPVGGMMTDLGTLGGMSSWAYDINTGGQVVGSSYITAGVRGFLWDPTSHVMTALGTLGGASSVAAAINNLGQIVGNSSLPNDTAFHAYLLPPGATQMRDLGTLGGTWSCAYDINDSGWVVGSSRLVGDTEYRAFLWEQGLGMRDLNDLIDPTDPLFGQVILTDANAINSTSQIAATGTLTASGETRALLLSLSPSIAALQETPDAMLAFTITESSAAVTAPAATELPPAELQVFSEPTVKRSFGLSILSLVESMVGVQSAYAQAPEPEPLPDTEPRACETPTIFYEVLDLPDTIPNNDLWQYRYTLGAYAFGSSQGFTVYFDEAQYGELADVSGGQSAVWDSLVWQPDPTLPDAGAYDALALIEAPPVTTPFTVSVVWRGSGIPGAQPFEVYNSAFAAIATGHTSPKPELSGQISVVPGTIEQGQTAAISYQISNVGQVDLAQANIETLVVRADDGAVIATFTDQTALNSGDSFENSQEFSSIGLEAGEYSVILRGGPRCGLETIDSTSLSVIPVIVGPTPTPPSGVIPEPATLVLVGLGLAGVLALMRRKRT